MDAEQARIEQKELEPKLGPKMRALTPRWRRFVRAIMSQSKRNAKAAAQKAGFTGSDEVLRVTGYRLWHDERVQAAIQEEAMRQIKTLLPQALLTVERVMEEGNGAEQLKAAAMVMDRSGLHGMQETKHTHEYTISGNPDQIKLIVMLGKQLGMNPEALLGRKLALEAPKEKEPAIEAEFEE